MQIETRLERLLPPASSDLVKLTRGVCPACSLRLEECVEQSNARLRDALLRHSA